MKWLKYILVITLLLSLSCAVIGTLAAIAFLYIDFTWHSGDDIPLGGDDSGNPPPPPPPPTNGCDGEYLKIALRDLQIRRASPGGPNDTIYIWVALLEKDSVISYSKGYMFIEDSTLHQFSRRSFSLPVNRSSLTPGIHQIVVYTSKDAEDVGIPQNRMWNSRAYLTDITSDYLYLESTAPPIQVLLGDSLRLYAHRDTTDSYNVIIDTIPGNETGVAWGMSGDNGELIIEGAHAIFIATHLTTQSRKTLLDDRVSADTCGRAELVVETPSGLGYTYNDFDDLIIHYADSLGIPPQLLKAQIDQESMFDVLEKGYRYEPMFDYDNIQDKLNQSPYFHYKLSGKDRYGNNLNTGDSIPYLEFPPKLVLAKRSSPDVDTTDTNPGDGLNLSVWELVDNNPNQGWTKPSSNFTAQVVISGSYGLLHIMYPTTQMNDYFEYGEISPQHLLDEDFGFEVATTWDKWLYDTYGRSWSNWDLRWKTVLGKYNGGPGAQQNPDGSFVIPAFQNYVDIVWQKTLSYLPH